MAVPPKLDMHALLWKGAEACFSPPPVLSRPCDFADPKSRDVLSVLEQGGGSSHSMRAGVSVRVVLVSDFVSASV